MEVVSPAAFRAPVSCARRVSRLDRSRIAPLATDSFHAGPLRSAAPAPPHARWREGAASEREQGEDRRRDLPRRFLGREVPHVRKHGEASVRNGGGQRSPGAHSEQGITRTEDDRRRDPDVIRAVGERARLGEVDGAQVTEQSLQPSRLSERTEILVHVVRMTRPIQVAALEFTAEQREHPLTGNRSHERKEPARDAERARRPPHHSRAVHEREPRDPFALFQRQRVGDGSPEPVADEAGSVDPEGVHELTQTSRVCPQGQRGIAGRVAASETEEVGHHHPVAGGHLGDSLAPEMPRRREPVEEEHRLARAP